MNLYQINENLMSAMTSLGELLENGEMPTDEQIDEILGLKDDLTNKLVGYGKFIKNIQSDIDGIDGEIKRLTAKKNALKSRNDILKQNMLNAMLTHDITKIDDPIMPIRVQNSPASVRLDIDPSRLPSEFQKVEIKANNTALANALKKGEEIQGVFLEQRKHIRVG